MTASTRQPDWPPAGILGASSLRLPQPDARPAVLVLVDEHHTGLCSALRHASSVDRLGSDPRISKFWMVSRAVPDARARSSRDHWASTRAARSWSG
jgi:hypothetical protein